MSRLSEAHARLNLRKEVITEDVMMVVSLYEEFMKVIFGDIQILPTYVKNITNINDVSFIFLLPIGYFILHRLLS